jgi:hypothetical protein
VTAYLIEYSEEWAYLMGQPQLLLHLLHLLRCLAPLGRFLGAGQRSGLPSKISIYCTFSGALPAAAMSCV